MKIPDSYETIIKLTFEDPELADSQVRIRRSYGLIDSAGSLLDVDLDAIKDGRGRPEDIAKLRALVEDFSGALVSWNFDDDDGEPLGTDLRTVRSRGDLFVLALVDSFLGALNEMATEAAGSLRQAAAAAAAEQAQLPMQVS